MYMILIVLKFIRNSRITNKRCLDDIESDNEFILKKSKTTENDLGVFDNLLSTEIKPDKNEYSFENPLGFYENDNKSTRETLEINNDDRTYPINSTGSCITDLFISNLEDDFVFDTTLDFSLELDISNSDFSQNSELQVVKNLEEKINKENHIIILENNQPCELDVDNNKELNDIYSKIIREYKTFSVSESVKFILEDKLEKILGNDLSQKINEIESKTPIRFNLYLKQLSEISYRKSNILDFHNNSFVKKGVNDFLNDYIVCKWRDEDEIYEEAPNNIIEKFGDYTKNSDFLKWLQKTFNDFLMYQFRKFMLFFKSEKGFFCKYKLFKIFLNKDESYNCEILIYILKRLFEEKNFAYVNFLFPEIKILINDLTLNNVYYLECRKVFFILGFIIFKSELLKNKIKDDINITINGFIYDYQYSITLCKYILDVRSLLYLVRESLIKKFGGRCLAQDKNMVIHLFFNYIRVFFPYTLKHYQVDEFFFLAYKFKGYDLMKPKLIHKETLQTKKIIEIWALNDFSKFSNYRNLEDFRLKIYETFKEIEELNIKKYFNTETLLDWDIENYFDILKRKYKLDLINLMG